MASAEALTACICAGLLPSLALTRHAYTYRAFLTNRMLSEHLDQPPRVRECATATLARNYQILLANVVRTSGAPTDRSSSGVVLPGDNVNPGAREEETVAIKHEPHKLH